MNGSGQPIKCCAPAAAKAMYLARALGWVGWAGRQFPDRGGTGRAAGCRHRFGSGFSDFLTFSGKLDVKPWCRGVDIIQFCCHVFALMVLESCFC